MSVFVKKAHIVSHRNIEQNIEYELRIKIHDEKRQNDPIFDSLLHLTSNIIYISSIANFGYCIQLLSAYLQNITNQQLHQTWL